MTTDFVVGSVVSWKSGAAEEVDEADASCYTDCQNDCGCDNDCNADCLCDSDCNYDCSSDCGCDNDCEAHA